jgi:hypothetical protein
LTFNLKFKVVTNLALISSPNPSIFGQPVTLTATVQPAQGTVPDGETVTFTVGALVLGTATINKGAATFTTSSLPVGYDLITATYSGDTQLAGSTGSLTQVVSQAASTNSLTSSLNPSTYGQLVAFTATVTSQFGAPITRGVTFYDGSAAIASVPIANNIATFSTSLLNAGSHSITAVYSGDGNTLVSTSTQLQQTVNIATTSTSVASSTNPSAAGQPVTFIAKVTPHYSGVPVGGTITFVTNGAVLAVVNVNNGSASFTSSTLRIGMHPIATVYSGSSNLFASAGVVQQKVTH